MKSTFLLALIAFMSISVAHAASAPTIYYGTCFMYKGAFDSSKTAEDSFYLTTQGQVLPEWPFSFPGNDDHFRISREWGDFYKIVNEDSNEVVAHQSIRDGTPLDIRYLDPISGWSVRCLKTSPP